MLLRVLVTIAVSVANCLVPS